MEAADRAGGTLSAADARKRLRSHAWDVDAAIAAASQLGGQQAGAGCHWGWRWRDVVVECPCCLCDGLPTVGGGATQLVCGHAMCAEDFDAFLQVATVVMVYLVMACMVVADLVMVYIVMAYIVMAYIVMACIEDFDACLQVATVCY